MSVNRDKYTELCMRLANNKLRKSRVNNLRNTKNFQLRHPYYVRFAEACKREYGDATYYPTQEATQFLCLNRLMRLKARNRVSQGEADYLYSLVKSNIEKAKRRIFSIKLWEKLSVTD